MKTNIICGYHLVGVYLISIGTNQDLENQL